ncbi:HTH-type transcriptional activator RhaR [compost metagenome]
MPSTSAAPALASPGGLNRRFIDQLTLALSTHLDERYGAPATASGGGGLSAWQLRRVRELIATSLADGLSVDRLARECALSRSHFTRVFKRSMGMSPHDWLLRMRIERARELMLNSTLYLSEISLECGFSDQSHFSRVFLRLTGMSPANWRRLQRPGKQA